MARDSVMSFRLVAIDEMSDKFNAISRAVSESIRRMERFSIVAERAERAMRGVSREGNAATRSLERLDIVAARLDGRNINMRVDVDDTAARARLAALSGSQRGSGGGGGGGRGMGMLIPAAVGLGPALLPMGGAALGVGAAFGTAAIGAGIFGAAVKGVIVQSKKNSKELEKANKALNAAKAHLAAAKPGTKAYADALAKVAEAQAHVNEVNKAFGPGQRAVVASIEKLKKSWNGFINDTSSSTAPVIATTINGLANAFKHLVPLIRAVAPVAQNVANSFKHWVDTGLDRWVGMIKTTGVPALRDLVTIGKNLGRTFGDMMRAFAPFGASLVHTLAIATAKLKAWADGGGFMRFMTWTKQNGPGLNNLLRALGQLLGAAAKSAGAFAPVSMLLATWLAKLATVLLKIPGSMHLLAAAFVAYKVAVASGAVYTAVFVNEQAILRGRTIASTVAMLAQKVAIGVTIVVMRAARLAILAWTAAQWLWNAAMTANPIGIVIVAIAALVAAIVLIATKTRWFQTAWAATWNAVKAVGLAVWHALSAAFHSVFNGMKAFATASWHAVASVFRSIWNGIKSFATASWHAILSVFKNTFNALKAFGSASWNAVSGIFKRIWNGVKAFATASWRSTLSVFKTIWNNVKAFATNSWNATANTGKRIFTGLKNTLHGIWEGIKSAAKSAWNALRNIVGAPVKFVINTVMGGLAKAFNSLAKAVHLKIHVPVPHVAFAKGGPVTQGRGGVDDVPAMLMKDEFVVRSGPAKKHRALLEQINQGGAPMPTIAGFNGGGAKGIMGMALGGIIPNPIDIAKKVGKGIVSTVKGGIDLLHKIPGVGNLVDMFGTWTKKILGKALGGITGLLGKIPGGGIVGDVGKSMGKSLIDGAIDLLMKSNDESGGGPIGGKIPAGARLALLKKALSITHTPPPGTLGSWLAGLNTLITRESSWNAGAGNNWDSNAKAGHPSIGLMQTIGPTFNAYKLPGHGNIRNGLDNVIAGIRYIKARYGNITNVQQANANKPPKGYWGGGTPHGQSIVGENGPEYWNGSRVTPMAMGRQYELKNGVHRPYRDSGSLSGGHLGTLELHIKGEDGKTIEKKLVTLKNGRGGRKLQFEEKK